MADAAFILWVVAGMALVRRGWGGSRRTGIAGWLLVAAALAVLTVWDGAWGLAVGSIAATLAALGFLAAAGFAWRPRRVARTRDSAATVSLHAESWRGVARRVSVFLLAVPGAGAASVLAALALAALGRALGWEEANGTALALLALPLVWGGVTTAMMLKPGPAAMLRPLVAVAAPAALLFGLAS